MTKSSLELTVPLYFHFKLPWFFSSLLLESEAHHLMREKYGRELSSDKKPCGDDPQMW